MSFNFDDVTKQVLKNVREETRKRILDLARRVKSEMGNEAQSIEYEYVTAHSGSKDSLGTLKVTGASDKLCEKFRDTVLSRFKF